MTHSLSEIMDEEYMTELEGKLSAANERIATLIQEKREARSKALEEAAKCAERIMQGEETEIPAREPYVQESTGDYEIGSAAKKARVYRFGSIPAAIRALTPGGF